MNAAKQRLILAEEITKELFGLKHSDTARSYNNLATIYFEKVDKALIY